MPSKPRPNQARKDVTLMFQVIVIGGGLSGAVLSLGLQQLGINYTLIERRTAEQIGTGNHDGRALAIAQASVNYLQEFAIDATIDAGCIKNIHVSDRGYLGQTLLNASHLDVDYFGYVTPLPSLEKQAYQQLASPSLQLNAQVTAIESSSNYHKVHLDNGSVLQGELIIFADGRYDDLKQQLGMTQLHKDYQQTALVGVVSAPVTQRFGANSAFERFTQTGPLALLPLAQTETGLDYAFVWSVSASAAQEIMASTAAQQLARLQADFGYRAGLFSQIAHLQTYPLVLTQHDQFAHRALTIGNAAQSLHPVAGQGFNLALRDIKDLLSLLASESQCGGDVGSMAFIQHYVSARQHDRQQLVLATDGLVQLFANDNKALVVARNLGLMVLNHLPLVKKSFAKLAMGYR